MNGSDIFLYVVEYLCSFIIIRILENERKRNASKTKKVVQTCNSHFLKFPFRYNSLFSYYKYLFIYQLNRI